MKQYILYLLFTFFVFAKEVDFATLDFTPTNAISISMNQPLYYEGYNSMPFPVNITSKLQGKSLTLYTKIKGSLYNEVVRWELNEFTIIDYDISIKRDFNSSFNNVKVALETLDGKLLVGTSKPNYFMSMCDMDDNEELITEKGERISKEEYKNFNFDRLKKIGKSN